MKMYYIVSILMMIPQSIFTMAPAYAQWPSQWELPTIENTALAFDLDDTIIEKSTAKLWGAIAVRGLWNSPLGLLGMARNKPKDSNGVSIEGATPQMIWHGIRSKNVRLQHFIPTILDRTAQSHYLKKGTPELFNILNNLGYQTMYATNKDRVSYDQAAAVLDKETTNAPGYEFSNAINKVLVTQPNEQVMASFNTFVQSNKVPNTPKMASFTALVERVVGAKETPKIKHVTVSKPDPAYFDRLKNMSDKKYIIFFDDKKGNAQAANRPALGMIGIQVKSPQDIVQALIALKIISPEQAAPVINASK